MKADRIQLDRIKGCKCEYATSLCGHKQLVRACNIHKSKIKPNNIEYGYYYLNENNEVKYVKTHESYVDDFKIPEPKIKTSRDKRTAWH